MPSTDIKPASSTQYLVILKMKRCRISYVHRGIGPSSGSWEASWGLQP